MKRLLTSIGSIGLSLALAVNLSAASHDKKSGNSTSQTHAQPARTSAPASKASHAATKTTNVQPTKTTATPAKDKAKSVAKEPAKVTPAVTNKGKEIAKVTPAAKDLGKITPVAKDLGKKDLGKVASPSKEPVKKLGDPVAKKGPTKEQLAKGKQDFQAKLPVKFKDYHLKYGKKFDHGTYYCGFHHKHWVSCVWNKSCGCYCYFDPCCWSWYYWCAPDCCYYPVSYCPYKCYCWSKVVECCEPCIPVCEPPVCVPVCEPVCVPVCEPVCVRVCVPVCYLPVCCVPVCRVPACRVVCCYP